MQPPALALNLLISERQEQRERFAENIKEIVDAKSEDCHLADIIVHQLFKTIERCVKNPNCSSRPMLFPLADFWNTFFKTNGDEPLLAA